MKAIPMLNRIGRYIVLAIGFMACVGWNQAVGLQNSTSNVPHKQVSDMVKVHYVLPYSNLHNVPMVCEMQTSTAGDALVSGITGLKGQQPWKGSEDLISQNSEPCDYVFYQELQKSPTLFAEFSCSTKQSVTDIFQSQGYFSGFDKQTRWAVSGVSGDTSNNWYSALGNIRTAPGVPTYAALGNVSCTAVVCPGATKVADQYFGTSLDTNDMLNADDGALDGASHVGVIANCGSK